MSAGFGAHKLRDHVRLDLLYGLLGRSACVIDGRLTYPGLSSLSPYHPCKLITPALSGGLKSKYIAAAELNQEF